MKKLLERVVRRFGEWQIYLYIREDEEHDLFYEVWTSEAGDPAYLVYDGYDYVTAISMFELQIRRASDAAVRDFQAEFKQVVSRADQMALDEIELKNALNELEGVTR